MSVRTGRPSSHSTRKTRLIATMPEPQMWASWRSTKVIGPPWRRSAQKSAAQAPRPDGEEQDVGPAGRDTPPEQPVGQPEEDEQGHAVADPEQAPVLEDRRVVGLAQQPARPGPGGSSSGPRPARREGRRPGRRPAPRRRDSAARAASGGTAARPSPGRDGPRGSSTRGGTGSCSRTSSIVSTGLAAWNGGRPVSIW